jgi:hypothetical protein
MFSESGTTISYRGMRLEYLGARGVMGNYRDVDTGLEYWISNPK